MYPIKINNYKIHNHLPSRFSCLLALGYSVLQSSFVLLPFIREKSIIILSYFMAVYICQIPCLCLTNEKTESSCVICLGLYLKSGSSAHFLTWVESIRPLCLSLGNCLETVCWSHRNTSFAAGIIGSEFFSCCLYFLLILLDSLPPCLSLISLCVHW